MDDFAILVDYIEGRITAEQFIWLLSYDDDLKDQIRLIYLKAQGLREYNAVSFIERVNVNKREDVNALDGIVEKVLEYKNITFCKREIKDELTVSDVLLPYLQDDALAEKYVFENVFQKADPNMTKAQKKRFCRDRQKELFRYEIRPPKWLQSGQWQYDKDGVPLVFQRSYAKEKGALAYVFVDPKADRQVEIIQYD